MFVEYVFIKRKKGFFNLNLYNVNISTNEIICKMEMHMLKNKDIFKRTIKKFARIY